MKKTFLLSQVVFLILIFAFESEAQQKRKSVNKRVENPPKIEVVTTGAPFSFGVGAPEEEENSWKELIVKQDGFAITFPGKPVRDTKTDRFEKKTITRINYLLDTKRALYALTYYNWRLSSKDSGILAKLYDNVVKYMLSEMNSGPQAELVKELINADLSKVVNQSDFNFGSQIGREVAFNNLNLGNFKARIVYYNGKIFSLVVFPSQNTSDSERKIMESSIEKLFKSFQPIENNS